MGIDKVDSSGGFVEEGGAYVWQVWIGKQDIGLHDRVNLTRDEWEQTRIEGRHGAAYTVAAFLQWYTSAAVLPYQQHIDRGLAVVPPAHCWG